MIKNTLCFVGRFVFEKPTNPTTPTKTTNATKAPPLLCSPSSCVTLKRADKNPEELPKWL
jgi:hypothetical protein